MTPYRVVGDWGTSRLRLFRIVDGQVTGRCEAPGIGAMPASPEAVLHDALAPWRDRGEPASIVLCGMVGSRNGWTEVPYIDCPADAAAWLRGAAGMPFGQGAAVLMAGLASLSAGAPDVMRGEETQLFGAIVREPRLAHGCHLVALPGTHSKWVRLDDGRVTTFQTFPTGEIFALLRDHSMLTRAAAGAETRPQDEHAGFDHGLARAKGGQLLGALFESRSAQLCLGRSAEWALGYISGLLLGREVAEAIADEAPDGVVVIGDPALTARYQRALQARGIGTTLLDGDACVVAGLDLLRSCP